ncbi:MAG TPA: hypothetical protein VI357_15380 [Mycobacteriales bacterium]
MIDVDASIVVCHSEKEQAAATFKHTFGYHPIRAFFDNCGEFLGRTRTRHPQDLAAPEHLQRRFGDIQSVYVAPEFRHHRVSMTLLQRYWPKPANWISSTSPCTPARGPFVSTTASASTRTGIGFASHPAATRIP